MNDNTINQPIYNNQNDTYSRDFYTITVDNTIGTWVDAFNKNALASSDHTWYLGEMLYNGILYTGRETIGGINIQALTNLNISSKSPQNIELDNFYLYFRDINKVLLLDHVTFDLTPYSTGHPMFFYINSDLGFRVSQQFNQDVNEIMLFRFIITTNGVFSQCYITSQRFGSNVYDTADEYYTIVGCQPLPATGLTLKLDNGTIKRSGIRFDYHQAPDVFKVVDNDIPFNLRYITPANKVDFSASTVTNIDPNKYLNYSTNTFSNVPTGKFTVQRILYDVYSNCLIMQYGDGTYDTMQEALSSVNNVTYPFPYESLMFIPLGLMFIKQGCTDLSNPDECILVQHTNTTITSTDSAFFAEDSYARGRLTVIQNDIEALQVWLQNLQNDLTSHTGNYNNPHQVTKAQVGLGKVDNMSYTEIKDSITNDLSNQWIKKNTNDSTSGSLNINGVTIPSTSTLNNRSSYILINNGQRLYLGTKPSDAPNGSWAIST